jgi:hypothetical protein
MTLVEKVEQFLYTHPVQHHKKELITLIKEAEEAYLKRIAELEQNQSLNEFNRMLSEGGNTIKLEHPEFCSCFECAQLREEANDFIGNRYETD